MADGLEPQQSFRSIYPAVKRKKQVQDMGPLPQTPSSPFLIMIPSIPQKGSYWNPDAEEPYYEEGPNYYGQPGSFFYLSTNCEASLQADLIQNYFH